MDHNWIVLVYNEDPNKGIIIEEYFHERKRAFEVADYYMQKEDTKKVDVAHLKRTFRKNWGPYL